MKTQKTVEIAKFHFVEEKNCNTTKEALAAPSVKFDLIDKNIINNTFLGLSNFIDTLPKDLKNKKKTSMYKEEDNEGKTKTYIFKDLVDRTVSGIIETGNYGKSLHTFDIIKDENAEPITTNKALLKPFYFIFCFSDKKNEGLIITERDGPYGVMPLMNSILKDYFKIKYGLYITIFEKFIDKKIVDEYINNGNYKNISLKRKSLPKEIAEKYGLENYKTEDFELELLIKAKGERTLVGKIKSKIINIFEEKETKFFSDQSLNSLGFDECSIIKVESHIGDSSRTIDLSDCLKLRPYYKIEVELNEKGNTDYQSIHEECLKLLEEYNLEIN